MNLEPGLPLPMTVIAGPLGAGKTTLVNAILAGAHGLHIAVLVNDFGEIALDENLIVARHGEMIALANGCACCSMDGGLWDAINRVLAMKPLPDRLVIETSGVADPARIHRIALADPDLADAGIVTVADTVNLATALDDPVLGETVRQQLRSSSLVVLAKTDLANDVGRDMALVRIAELTPGRPVLFSAPGKVPVESVLSAPPAAHAATIKAGPMRITPIDHGAVYASWAWSGAETVDRDRLHDLLGADDCGIWRIKGIVHDSAGRRLAVHRVGNQVEIAECDDGKGPARIVAVGPADRFRADEIERRWQAILAKD